MELIYLFRERLCTATRRFVGVLPHFSTTDAQWVLEDNADLRQRLRSRSIPLRKLHTFTTSAGRELIYASTCNDEDNVTMALIDVYGGPGSQKAVRRFSLGFTEYMASSHNVCVYSLDARGTGFNNRYGNNFTYAVKNQLGVLESQDLVEFANHLKDVTHADVAMWGWSYGGFMASMALSSHCRPPFTKLVSVAPVTDWRFYDSAYTERYMDLPTNSSNLKGYKTSSVLERVKAQESPMPGDFLLVHGLADDNVHPQNGLNLDRFLRTYHNQFTFRTQYYVNQDHGLGEVTTSLYTLLTDFLLRGSTD